jgi:hypothetical protein
LGRNRLGWTPPASHMYQAKVRLATEDSLDEDEDVSEN